MARIYAELIKRGLKTIDDVPKALQKAVKELLVGVCTFAMVRKSRK